MRLGKSQGEKFPQNLGNYKLFVFLQFRPEYFNRGVVEAHRINCCEPVLYLSQGKDRVTEEIRKKNPFRCLT